jgi:hypothetical protein
MTLVTDGSPTFTHTSNYLNEAAHLLVCYHDDMLEAPDLAAKYNVILRHDAKLRAFVVDRMPAFMAPSTPYNPAWPPWVQWMRRMYQASYAHKIIMMHQTFLSRSFKQPQYTYTRWACCNAAKIIIEELCQERGPEEPQWWVSQAILVTAGICLALDIFHRTEREPEAESHLQLIKRAISTLEQWATSSVAHHGICLLNSLLQEYARKNGIEIPTSQQSRPFPPFPTRSSPPPPPRLNATTAGLQPGLFQNQSAMTGNTLAGEVPFGWGDMDFGGIDDFMDAFPMDTGLESNMFMESFLSLAGDRG